MALTGFERNLETPVQFTPFFAEDEARFSRAAKTVTRRLEQYGCFPLFGGEGLRLWVKTAIHHSREYFSLPDAEKQRAEIQNISQSGFMGVGREVPEGGVHRICRQSLTLNRPLAAAGQGNPFRSEESPHLAAPKAFLEGLGQLQYTLSKLADELLQAIAHASGEKKAFFNAMTRDGLVGTRAFYYRLDEQGDDIVLTPHKDVGLLTILTGATAPGLEMQDPKTGDFVPVRQPYSDVVVMAGELLEYITAGAVKAPNHRVRLDGSAADRLSIATFINGNDVAKIKQMGSDEDNPYHNANLEYRAMTPMQFVRARIVASGYSADDFGL